MSRRTPFFLLVALALSATACSRAPQRSAVPEHLTHSAEIPGFYQVRYSATVEMDTFIKEELDPADIDDTGLIGRDDQGRSYYSYLVLTAGGSNGAFAAGFLKGWTESGERPEFKVVTGVSSGAMIATFAFLGSDYDEEMERFYLDSGPENVFTPRSKLALLTSNSINKTDPLWCMISEVITQDLVEKVAREHRRGRRLYVGTTNLDTQQLVVWDMGKIARRGGQEALCLYRKVLYASASIPVYFPPVYICVEAEGCHYDEMHVDGATISHVMAPEGAFDRLEEEFAATGLTPLGSGVKLYVIRNGAVRGSWDCVEDKLLSIANRGIDTVIMHHSLADLHRLYCQSRDRGVDFNLAHIPLDYSGRRSGIFQPEEMQRLFHVGEEQARKGYKWRKQPLNFQP